MYAIRSYYDGTLGLKPPNGLSLNDYAFRRDCLEADIVKDGRVLTLFVCHFKSMYGGRRKTRITSYNVCYTKLLRFSARDCCAPAPARYR